MMASKAPRTEDCARSSRVILIVANHDTLRMTLRTWIASAFRDCRLQVARTSEEALVACRAEAPELVLVDSQLPGTDGLQVMGHIHRINPATHVVMLASHDLQALRSEALAAGAAGFVPKAQMTHALLPLLESVLRERPGEQRADSLRLRVTPWQ